jgi:hypothetical protein
VLPRINEEIVFFKMVIGTSKTVAAAFGTVANCLTVTGHLWFSKTLPFASHFEAVMANSNCGKTVLIWHVSSGIPHHGFSHYSAGERARRRCSVQSEIRLVPV